MGNSADLLFRPFESGPLKLPNRVVMAPMTRNFSPNGIPGDDVAAYYRRRAEKNCGLIITEGTTIRSPVAGGYPDVPHFWGDALTGWKRVADEVHAAGGRIIPQIWHVGLQRHPKLCPNPELVGVGPSGIGHNLKQVTEPMSLTEIDETVRAFAQAARSALDLGFDGVELHGAHGYLIDQFLWEKTNLREDHYGGDIEGRTRFAAEIIAACRQEIGPDFPLLFRFSQWKGHDYGAKLAHTPQELERFLAPLVDAGVDIFDCSTRRFWEPEFVGSELNLAGWTKKLSGKPVITVGSVTLTNDFINALHRDSGAEAMGLDQLLDRLERDEFDLVAVGRGLLADAAWTSKVRELRLSELQPYRSEALKTLA